MKRYTSALRAMIALFAIVISASQSAPALAAAPVTRTGVIKVLCTIVTDASVAKGSAISVDVSASGTGTDVSQSVDGSIQVKKASTSQTVTLLLPYKWTLTNPSTVVPIYLSVAEGSYPNTVSVETSLSIPLPANGATTVVSIPVRI
jgi:hypothetical protein